MSLSLKPFGGFLIVLTSFLLALNIFEHDNKAEALTILPIYRMHQSGQRVQRVVNPWSVDYRFNRPGAFYQPTMKKKRDAMMMLKRERILDSLGGDYLIRKRDV